MRREQFYVLRLWNDGASPEDWRVALSPLVGGPERYFISVQDFSRFLGEGDGLHLRGWDAPPSPSGPSS
ncbi:hypothetical protein [Deinococcus hopiensis]|uniref:Uncharacterized protein n=1 Tax=Deinococcus hopiensis KR-140 TaxID=695939 RepID=A0A1W1ULE3_9DEIO|nr:hypothetical protein [Deinococcus hopiensis]SMB81631.1 hypothetical protein SAMN00790413_04655 [Deinococcus hopiensis KR-140]